jgi:Halobacterial output domain 1
MTEADLTADDWQLVEQAQYDRDGRHDLTTAIIATIATAEGVAPAELKEPVLYECVDVAAIEDSFFGPEVIGQNRDGDGTVAFRFGDYRVEIANDGVIAVYAPTSKSVEKYIGPSQRPSTVVQQVIAQLEECDPAQLGTLSTAVAIDELDSIVDESYERGKNGRGKSIAFQYCGYSIEISSNGRIRIDT